MWDHIDNGLVFFNDTATTEIYTLSLHDALPIYRHREHEIGRDVADDPLLRMFGRYRVLHHDRVDRDGPRVIRDEQRRAGRSEEHTSELQSRQYLVCRLLLEKKKHNEDVTYTETT